MQRTLVKMEISGSITATKYALRIFYSRSHWFGLKQLEEYFF